MRFQVIIGLCLALASSAWADSVKLRFGLIRHQGQIVSVDQQQVVLVTPDGQSLTWPRHHVADIRFDNPPAPPEPFRRKPTSSNPVDVKESMFQGLITKPITKGSPVTSAAPEPVGLAQFKGHPSQTRYWGLYQINGRPTCWLNLGKPLDKPTPLSFTLFNKWNPAQKVPSDGYRLTARFLDEHGKLLGQAPVVTMKPPGTLSEWFIYLDGMSGVADPQPVTWQLPPKTQTVEWVVLEKNAVSQLVGYLAMPAASVISTSSL